MRYVVLDTNALIQALPTKILIIEFGLTFLVESIAFV